MDRTTDADNPPNDARDPLVDVRSVSHRYRRGNTLALSEVSLTIDSGTHVSITGKSGCGKTTLLNLIGGLARPTSGTILFDGRPLGTAVDLDHHRCHHVGFVFQSYYLLPNLTAQENVQIPMMASSRSPSERSRRAAELLRQVGLADRADHRPAQLSGGEAQRVAIARSLANDPRLILADEPTGALDSESGAAILDLLERLRQSVSLTLVVVTHEASIAARARHQIRLQDGRIVD